MPLFDRDTLIDRPTIIKHGDDEEEEEEIEQTITLNKGTGPVVNGVRFDQGQYGLMAAANAAAILATGEAEGETYKRSFGNAAIQLQELKNQDTNINDLARFSIERGVAEEGIEEHKVEQIFDQDDAEQTDDTTTEPDSEEQKETEEDETTEETEVDEGDEESNDAETNDAETVEQELEEVEE